MKEKDKVYAVCYDTLYVFDNIEEALRMFLICYYTSEGAEQGEYASVLTSLNYGNICEDKPNRICKNIYIEGNKDTLRIKLNNKMSYDDTVKYYEKKIKPILETARKYNIDFNNKIPFEDFSDDGTENMYNFSDFYNDILQNKNIEHIETNEISDGKYELNIYPSIGNVISLDITAWDKIEKVIDNVNTINNEFEKNNDSIFYDL